MISIACPDSSIAVEIFMFGLLYNCQISHVYCFLFYQKVSLYTCSCHLQEFIFGLNLLMGLLRLLQFLIPVIHAGFFYQLLDPNSWRCKLLRVSWCFCLHKIKIYDFKSLCLRLDTDFSEFLYGVIHWMRLLSFWSENFESFCLLINPVDDSLMLQNFLMDLLRA
jgi:hypothetical protein